MNKTILKIGAATSMCIFSLFAVFAGSVAWFTSSQNADNTAGDIAVAQLSTNFSKMSYHAYVDTSDSSYRFTQTESASVSTASGNASLDSASSVEMEEYTLLDRSHPVLMLFQLSSEVTASEDSPITITFSTSSAYLGETDESGAATQTLTQSGNPLSSVVHFAVASYSTSDFTSSVDDSTNSYYVVPEPSEYVSFVTFSGNTPSFSQSLTVCEITSGSVQYICVVLDYFESSLDYIYSVFLGDTLLEDDIYFTCDWTVAV